MGEPENPEGGETMPRLIAAIGLLAMATPAFAGTLEEVTTHGIILIIGDMQIPVTYTPDHKFTAADGQITGAWRIDGDNLCTTSNYDPKETCVTYPKDKKSGDSFDLTGPTGTATIKIR
jgi:hypothetical protein